jgi:hypothetical protein
MLEKEKGHVLLIQPNGPTGDVRVQQAGLASGPRQNPSHPLAIFAIKTSIYQFITRHYVHYCRRDTLCM